jgi:hypothetical protein
MAKLYHVGEMRREVSARLAMRPRTLACLLFEDEPLGVARVLYLVKLLLGGGRGVSAA